MKKSTILLSTLVLGLTFTSPAYARSHAHGHHSSHGSHHSPHISHDSHISGPKSPSTKSPSTKSPSTKSPSKSPSTKKECSIKHPYNDQEISDIFNTNKLQSSYQKTYHHQSIFNNRN